MARDDQYGPSPNGLYDWTLSVAPADGVGGPRRRARSGCCTAARRDMTSRAAPRRTRTASAI
ncbi:hypothetical protein E4K10_20350 [Streptomyces sp. T1317-0309]|nr:hypothetical protein E4K10_20350 [Streptomyces sp. T1317-0309]